MKKVLLGLLILCAWAGVASAEAYTNTWRYYPQLAFIPSSCTNVGVTGLSTGVSYVVFPTLSITNITEAQATTNSDFRVLMYALSEKLYQAVSTSTNAFTKCRVGRSQLSTTSSDAVRVYVFEYDINFGTPTIDGE